MVGENADLVVVWPRWPAMVGENADFAVVWPRCPAMWGIAAFAAAARRHTCHHEGAVGGVFADLRPRPGRWGRTCNYECTYDIMKEPYEGLGGEGVRKPATLAPRTLE